MDRGWTMSDDPTSTPTPDEPTICVTPTCDRSVTHAEFCAPCMQAMDYGAGACGHMIHPCDHHRKAWAAHREGERAATQRIADVVKWWTFTDDAEADRAGIIETIRKGPSDDE